jgi:hypothetical protein
MARSDDNPRPYSRTARVQCFDRQAPEVLDERQPQHARPRPELADRQGSNALIAVEEHAELVPVESAVAVAKQFDRDGVNPCLADVAARCERRQFKVVGPWQVPADVADVRRDEMEVVEEPLGRRRDERATTHVFDERAIRRVQDADVVAKPGEDVERAVPGCRVQRKGGGERERASLETLDAQELVTKRSVLRRRRALEVAEE